MLSLKKFKNRIIHLGSGDIQPLCDMLPAYGSPGLYTVADIVNNPNHSESVRLTALIVLGVHNYQLPNGLPFLMSMVEKWAEFAQPDLDLVCFVSVFANAIKGRPEAIALVERFKVGTDRQRAVFQQTDRDFLKGMRDRYIVEQFEAKRKNG